MVNGIAVPHALTALDKGGTSAEEHAVGEAGGGIDQLVIPVAYG